MQHRGLREASAIDLATIDFLVKAVKWIAPDIDYQAGAGGQAARLLHLFRVRCPRRELAAEVRARGKVSSLRRQPCLSCRRAPLPFTPPAVAGGRVQGELAAW